MFSIFIPWDKTFIWLDHPVLEIFAPLPNIAEAIAVGAMSQHLKVTYFMKKESIGDIMTRVCIVQPDSSSNQLN